MRNVGKVSGRYFANPPILRMSCSPLSEWMTDPEPRKSSALKNACAIIKKIAAEYAPTPTARTM